MNANADGRIPRLTLVTVFVASLMLGMAFSPSPSVAYTPPLPPVSVESEGRAAAIPDPEIVVFVDVPIKVAPDVVAGVRAWERATKGWRRWRLGHAAEAHMWIIQVEPGKGHCPVWASGCAGAMGGLERDPSEAWGRAWLIRGNYEAGAKVITMHEIGHSLGLWHVEGTMMQAAPSIEQYLAEWRCPDGESLARLEWRIGVVLDTRECVQ